MKKFVLFGALLACSMAVGAEVRVDSLNRLVLDGFEQLQPQDSVGVIPHSISANQDFPIFGSIHWIPKQKCVSSAMRIMHTVGTSLSEIKTMCWLAQALILSVLIRVY